MRELHAVCVKSAGVRWGFWLRRVWSLRRMMLVLWASGVARNLSRGEQIRGGQADEFTTKMFGILIAR